MPFKENLRHYRQKAGLTSKEMASRLGITSTTYWNYENLASEPKYAMLLEICRILGCSPNDLLGYTGSTDSMDSEGKTDTCTETCATIQVHVNVHVHVHKGEENAL